MPEEFGVVIDAETHIVIEGSFYNYNRARKHFSAWLVINGETVGMIRYLVGGTEEATLCDIEIRKEHRGKKLSATFIKLLETKVIGEQLFTTGHFTPEGHRSLADVISMPEWAIKQGKEPEVAYRSMGFVENWDTFALIH